MNILVLGANGLPGTALRQVSAAAPDRYIFSDITAPRGCDTLYLDIADTDAVRLICRSERVDVVVNCAAFGDPAKPSADAALCRQVLPRYWMPRHYVSTPTLPMTETGKIARGEAEKIVATKYGC